MMSESNQTQIKKQEKNMQQNGDHSSVDTHRMEAQKRVLFSVIKNFLESRTNTQLDLWLKTYFRAHKKFGSKDRKFIRHHFYHILRKSGFYLILEDAGRWEKSVENIETGADLRDFLLSNLSRVLNLHFEHENRHFCNLNGSQEKKYEISIAGARDLAAALSLPMSMARQMYPRVAKMSEEEKTTFLDHFLTQNRTWAYLKNHENLELLTKKSNEKGVQLESDKNNLWFAPSTKISRLQLETNHIFEIQDLASQKLCALTHLEISPKKIWDCCAGAGGKTLQLARQYPKASFLASDPRESALKELGRRWKASGHSSSIRTEQGKISQLSERLVRETFDFIFIDAPCSSSGVLRRQPDLKLHYTDKMLRQIRKVQTSILNTALKHLEPHGYLVYATCSAFAEENEAVVERFLSENKNMKQIESTYTGSPDINADIMFRAVLQKID